MGPRFETVQYPAFRPPNWYARATWPDGRVTTSEPWLTETAARYLLNDWRRRFALVVKRTDSGNGDECPLFPEHGHMLTVQDSDPPLQWCPHVQHDGGTAKSGIPPSRAAWPLYGLESSVATYLARLDNAIRLAELPDLSDVEVT